MPAQLASPNHKVEQDTKAYQSCVDRTQQVEKLLEKTTELHPK